MSSDSDEDSDTKRLPLPLRPLSFAAFCDFRPESRDVVLVCYPKCDTKVIEVILWKLLKPRTELPALDNRMGRYVQCVETASVEGIISSQQWPRLFKTHLPKCAVPIHHKAKYIYVLRNPWDTVVSCYRTSFFNATTTTTTPGHHQQSFDEFFKRFIDNEHGYGNFFDHVKHWTSKTNIERENFIAMTHEAIKSQPRSALFTIAAFLGEPYLGTLLQSDDVVLAILRDVERFTSYGHQKRAKRSIMPVLSDEQIKTIEEKLELHLKATDIEHQWKNMLENIKLKNVGRYCVGYAQDI